MKKSVVAAVAASNVTIFSGLVDASLPVWGLYWGWERFELNELFCWVEKKALPQDQFPPVGNLRAYKCRFVGLTGGCDETVECGVDLNGNVVTVDCEIHKGIVVKFCLL